ncbi:hypothetical protein [Tunturiibacter gelidiferens]|uniref:hypothetical protein n=1 Tax=Tunturiibacter gelidiferens TaxID=3069689 RepID=UPI003D9B98F0
MLLVVSSGLLLNAGASQVAAPAQATPALTIKNIGPGVVAIDGDWQFHLGDDMHWIDPAYDDSQWEHIKADKNWGEQTHPGYAGFAWYRRHLDIAPPVSGRQKLAILMPPVDSAYEIYWNGEKVGHQGVLPPGAVGYYSHRESFALPSSLSGAERGLLALRAWRAQPNSTGLDTTGGLSAPPLIGAAPVIAAKVGQADFLRLNASLFGRALSFFFLLIGTVSFFVWVRDREKGSISGSRYGFWRRWPISISTRLT